MADWKGTLLTLLVESFEGMQGTGTWFADSEKGAGLFGTLASVSAEQASLTAGRSTVAAQAVHMVYYVRVINAYARLEDPKPNWESSWTEQQVSAERWQEVQRQLREEYEEFKKFCEATEDWELEAKRSGAMAAVCHAAFHLGAIRHSLWKE